MDALAPVVVFVLLLAAVALVTQPLRSGRAAEVDAADEARREDLEAAKEAKYREIRDAELDFRTGKLSDEDWRAQDRRLRAEAVELLQRLDDLGPAEAARTLD